MDYEKIADILTHKTAKKLEKENKLYLIGTGGGMIDDIKMMSMSFNYYHEVNIKLARELVVSSVNEYLIAINNNKKIRPCLHEYPFTSKNVEINIFIYKLDHSYPPQDKIQCISAINGNVKYFLHEPGRPYKLVHKESFEEAVRVMQRDSTRIKS